MADKEFLLGNRARELLKYTKQATRVVSGDISKADVRAIITRVAELDDICDVKSEISKPFDGSNTVHHHQRESYPVARLCMDGR